VGPHLRLRTSAALARPRFSQSTHRVRPRPPASSWPYPVAAGEMLHAEGAGTGAGCKQIHLLVVKAFGETSRASRDSSAIVQKCCTEGQGCSAEEQHSWHSLSGERLHSPDAALPPGPKGPCPCPKCRGQSEVGSGSSRRPTLALLNAVSTRFRLEATWHVHLRETPHPGPLPALWICTIRPSTRAPTSERLLKVSETVHCRDWKTGIALELLKGKGEREGGGSG